MESIGEGAGLLNFARIVQVVTEILADLSDCAATR